MKMNINNVWIYVKYILSIHSVGTVFRILWIYSDRIIELVVRSSIFYQLVRNIVSTYNDKLEATQ